MAEPPARAAWPRVSALSFESGCRSASRLEPLFPPPKSSQSRWRSIAPQLPPCWEGDPRGRRCSCSGEKGRAGIRGAGSRQRGGVPFSTAGLADIVLTAHPPSPASSSGGERKMGMAGPGTSRRDGDSPRSPGLFLPRG